MVAKNTNNRIPVKWVRDKAKKAYEKQPACYICNTNVDLELHHLKSITLLLENWALVNHYDISTDDGILAVRDEFIAQHHVELYDEVYTLCNRHHVQLHGVYGKSPPFHSAPKQQHWIDVQREKLVNDPKQQQVVSYGSFFSKFT